MSLKKFQVQNIKFYLSLFVIFTALQPVNLSFIRSNLEVLTFPPQHGFEKSLCDHCIQSRSPGVKIGQLGGGEQGKLILHLKCSLFAIEILLVGVQFGAILGRTPIFQVRRCQKSKFMLFIVVLELLCVFLSAFVNLVSLKS